MDDTQNVKNIDAWTAAYDGADDDQVLSAIASLTPLVDETDALWTSEEYYRTNAYPFMALADIAAKRRLRPAVRLLLERACYGDPGEIMRSLRHVFEAIYKPDWTSLADEYLALARAERLGTRLWAIDGLMVMDDARAVPVFEASSREDPEAIRSLAQIGLKRLLNPEQISAKAAKQEAVRERARHERLEREAEADAQITDRRCSACGKPLPSYRRTCKHCGAAAI